MGIGTSENRVRLENGEMKLGGDHLNLVSLSELLSISKKEDGSCLHIFIDNQWFDITLLSHLTQLIKIALKKYDKVIIDTLKLPNAKISYLWEVGFWNSIRRISSNLECIPSPLMVKPSSYNRKINYTKIISYNADSRRKAEDIAEELKNEIIATVCYEVVNNTDIMLCEHYFHFMLQELVRNVQLHSGSSYASIAAQIFLSPDHIDCLNKYYDKNSDVFRRLKKQHQIETQHNILPMRNKWLQEHKTDSFILISCVDTGIGIPESIRKRFNASIEDGDALSRAFDINYSTRLNNPDVYDVHGLSQLLDIVHEFDGYLFVQGSSACIESTKKYGKKIANASRLSGTLFQILLPLSAKPASFSSYKLDLEQLSSSKVQSRAPDLFSSSLQIFNWIRQFNLNNRDKWIEIVRPIVAEIREKDEELVFVDLVCMPSDRQFISYLLRIIRKAASNKKGIVVINASITILIAVERMLKLKESGKDIANVSETISLGLDSCKNTQDSSYTLDDIEHLEYSITKAYSSETSLLTMLLPFISISENPEKISILWLGLSCLPHPYQKCMKKILDELFHQEQKLSWDEIHYICQNELYSASISKDIFLRKIRNTIQINKSFFSFDQKGVNLRLNKEFFYSISYHSLQDQFESQILNKAKHIRPSEKEHYIYSLAWHEPHKRFRKEYYYTWNILQDKNNRYKLAKLLIMKSYTELNERFSNIKAIVSVTPSAGLLGKEIANMLKADFWETSSIYDIDKAKWIPNMEGGNVIIVDDLIDTGGLTRKIFQRFKFSEANCVAVLTLLESKEGKNDRKDIPSKVIAITSVSLGLPSKGQIDEALQKSEYYEVDPHTLAPLVPYDDGCYMPPEHEKRLKELIENDVFKAGHIVNSDHHYDIYFSLPDALFQIKDRMIEWVKRTIIRFSEENGHPKVLDIVYPYYSPILCLINDLQNEYPDNVIRSESFEIKLRYTIAQPCQQPGYRMGYQLGIKENADNSDDNLYYEYALFLDDGVSSGNTLAEILEKLLLRKAKAIGTLVLFDRMRIQPIRNLRNVSSFDKNNVNYFSYQLLDITLPSYSGRNCPQCNIIAKLDRISNKSDLLPGVVEELKEIFKETISGYSRLDLQDSFAPESIYEIIHFRNAVFSRKISPRQIENILEKKNPESRLACIQTILTDPNLNMQVVDKEKYIALIKNSFLSNEIKSSNLRAQFILYLSLWVDQDFAFYFATDVLPDIFVALSPKISLNGMPLLPLTKEYFLKHRTEFEASMAIMCLLKEEEEDLFTKNQWRQKWEQAISSNSLGKGTGSIYFYELRKLFAKDSDFDTVIYLIASFLGSYRKHDDAYKKRLILFTSELARDIPRFKEALQRMPRALFMELVRSIVLVQDRFMFTIFTDSDFKILEESIKEFYNSPNKKIIAMVDSFFLDRNPDGSPSLIKKLREITPKVSDLLDKVKQLSYAQYVDFDCDQEFLSFHVLGNTETLLIMISAFLKNSFEAQKEAENGQGKIQMTLHVSRITVDNISYIKFGIVDSLVEDALEYGKYFNKLGALQSHKIVMKRMGGNMDIKNSEDMSQKTAYLLVRDIELYDE